MAAQSMPKILRDSHPGLYTRSFFGIGAGEDACEAIDVHHTLTTLGGQHVWWFTSGIALKALDTLGPFMFRGRSPRVSAGHGELLGKSYPVGVQGALVGAQQLFVAIAARAMAQDQQEKFSKSQGQEA